MSYHRLFGGRRPNSPPSVPKAETAARLDVTLPQKRRDGDDAAAADQLFSKVRRRDERKVFLAGRGHDGREAAAASALAVDDARATADLTRAANSISSRSSAVDPGVPEAARAYPDFWTPRRLHACALVSNAAPRVWVTAPSAWPYRTWPTARDTIVLQALTQGT